MFHLLMLRRCLLRRRLASIPGKAWSVSLSAESGWGSIRERLVYGELEAAHASGPLLFSILLGTHSRACGVTTDLVLGLQGNAITRRRFYGTTILLGVTAAATVISWMELFVAADLASEFRIAVFISIAVCTLLFGWELWSASRGLRDASNRNHRSQQAIRVLLPW
jgi:NMT1-like family